MEDLSEECPRYSIQGFPGHESARDAGEVVRVIAPITFPFSSQEKFRVIAALDPGQSVEFPRIQRMGEPPNPNTVKVTRLR